MPTDPNQTPDEAAVRALVEGRPALVRAKDLDGLSAPMDPDIVTFDVVGPLRNVGPAEVRERTARWLSAYPGEIAYEVRDVDVTAGADVAFARFLYHIHGTLAGGAVVDMWVRSTVCLQKKGGAWRIVHAHDSAPFDPETGKASLDLTP